MNVLKAEAVLKDHREGDQITVDLWKEKFPVVIRKIQNDFLKRQFLEIDFQTIFKGEK